MSGSAMPPAGSGTGMPPHRGGTAPSVSWASAVAPASGSRLRRAAAAEVRKLSTVWSTPVLAAIGLVLTVGLGVLIGYATGAGNHNANLLVPTQGSAEWFDAVFSVMTIAQDLALVIGVVTVTAEFRHRTVTSTFLTEPRRGTVVAAKLVIAALAGAALAVVAAVGDLVLGAVMVASGDGNASTMLTELGHVAPGVIAAAALFGVYGAGLGALLRNQVAALVVGLGATVVVEPIIRGVARGVGKWLPSAAAQSLDSVTAHAQSGFGATALPLLSPGTAAAVLLGYGVLLAAAGALTTMRADIT